MVSFRIFPGNIKLVLWSALVLNAAKFSVTAFLAVYLSKILRLPVWQTGTILSTALIVNYALPAFLGAVTDRIGYRSAMALGCGFIGIGYSSSRCPRSFRFWCWPLFSPGWGAHCLIPPSGRRWDTSPEP